MARRLERMPEAGADDAPQDQPPVPAPDPAPPEDAGPSPDDGASEDDYSLPALPEGDSIPRQLVEDIYGRAQGFASDLASLADLREITDEAGGVDRVRQSLTYADLMDSQDGQAYLAVHLLRGFGVSDQEIADLIEGKEQGGRTGPAPATLPPSDNGDQPPPAVTEDRIRELLSEHENATRQLLTQQSRETIMNQSSRVLDTVLAEANIPNKGRARDVVLYLIDSRLGPDEIAPDAVKTAAEWAIGEWRKLLGEAANGPTTKTPPRPLTGGGGAGTTPTPTPPKDFEDAVRRSRHRIAERLGVPSPEEGGSLT